MKKNKKQTIQKKQKSLGFFQFIISKKQLPDWIIMFAICLIGYIILKICYPFPNCIVDSFGYIHAAAKAEFYFYRPYGYSLFLRMIHAISSSVHAIFIVQIIIYFFSTAIFLFTIKYFYKPASKIIWYILLVVFSISPMGFRLSNTILSDLIYGAVVYIIIVSFIFIIKKQHWLALMTLVIFLFFSLHIRYSSIVFPVIFIAFLFMIKGIKRWLGIVAIMFVTMIFHNQVKTWMKETTKFHQYSTGFDGWQMASNAMHIIPFIDMNPKDIKKPEIRQIHEFIIPYKDSIRKVTNDGKKVVSGFLWDQNMPLKLYLAKQIKETGKPYTNLWIKLGSTTYSEYGKILIMKYPIQFLRYYFFPNSIEMFYSTRDDAIALEVPIKPAENTSWYNIPEDKDTSNKHEIYKNFLGKADQMIWAIHWIFMLAAFVLGIIYRKKINFSTGDKKVFWGIFIFAMIYYSSIIFASPITFRYWFAIRCANFACFYILLNKLIIFKFPKKMIIKNRHENSKENTI